MELHEIVGYLPYGLKFISRNGKYAYMSIDGCFATGFKTRFGENINKSISFETLIRNYKPILHPLSDLVKPVLPDGKIPLVEIFNYAFDQNVNQKRCDFLSEDGIFQMSCGNLQFGFDCECNSFITTIYQDGTITPNQLQLFQKLYSWHFDIHGLIEKNQAVNTDCRKIVEL